jgi:uncharacterized SAM-binding protein YcdF (DUF218 family)
VTAEPRRPRRRGVGVGRALLVLLVLAALLWIAGFVDFVRRLPEPGAAEDGTADAIVVLTGGAERLREGLRLLAEARAPRLFISGVHPDATLAQLLAFVPEYKSDPAAAAAVACCVVLGRAAADTEGNARETAAWLRGQHLRSLFLVTADYHMPRSLLEFRRALPDAEIKPHAVFPQDPVRRGWWRRANAFALVLIEYHKYLLAAARGLFQPEPGPPPSPI